MFSQKILQKAHLSAEFFEKAINKRQLAQAYILTGLDQDLKYQVAKELNLILNCENNQSGEKSVPCGQCMSCKWIEGGTHPETPIILQPEEKERGRGTILIDQAKALISKLSKTSKFTRLVIIPYSEREYWEQAAVNSLLKTIEEFQERVYFLLFARDADLVLPTILSRSQILHLPSEENIENDYSELQPLIDQIFMQRNLSYYDVTQLAEGVDNQSIELLANYCAEQYLASADRTWLRRQEIIDEALTRLRAFCNAKMTIEELFFELSKN